MIIAQSIEERGINARGIAHPVVFCGNGDGFRGGGGGGQGRPARGTNKRYTQKKNNNSNSNNNSESPIEKRNKDGPVVIALLQ